MGRLSFWGGTVGVNHWLFHGWYWPLVPMVWVAIGIGVRIQRRVRTQKQLRTVASV